MSEVFTDWKPWETHKAQLPVLNISEPPCKYCLHWRPLPRFRGVEQTGVVCCHAEVQERDFSCFKKDGAKVPILEITSSPPEHHPRAKLKVAQANLELLARGMRAVLSGTVYPDYEDGEHLRWRIKRDQGKNTYKSLFMALAVQLAMPHPTDILAAYRAGLRWCQAMDDAQATGSAESIDASVSENEGRLTELAALLYGVPLSVVTPSMRKSAKRLRMTLIYGGTINVARAENSPLIAVQTLLESEQQTTDRILLARALTLLWDKVVYPKQHNGDWGTAIDGGTTIYRNVLRALAAQMELPDHSERSLQDALSRGMEDFYAGRMARIQEDEEV